MNIYVASSSDKKDQDKKKDQEKNKTPPHKK